MQFPADLLVDWLGERPLLLEGAGVGLAIVPAGVVQDALRPRPPP